MRPRSPRAWNVVVGAQMWTNGTPSSWTRPFATRRRQWDRPCASGCDGASVAVERRRCGPGFTSLAGVGSCSDVRQHGLQGQRGGDRAGAHEHLDRHRRAYEGASPRSIIAAPRWRRASRHVVDRGVEPLRASARANPGRARSREPRSAAMSATDPIRYLGPSQAAGRAFVLRGLEGSVVMLNLLRFRDVGDYAAHPELVPRRPSAAPKPSTATYVTRSRSSVRAAGISRSSVPVGRS